MSAAEVDLRYFRAGGLLTVHAVCKNRERLEDWIADQYALWPGYGYGTMAGQIRECPEGFTVNVFRAESCE